MPFLYLHPCRISASNELKGISFSRYESVERGELEGSKLRPGCCEYT